MIPRLDCDRLCEQIYQLRNKQYGTLDSCILFVLNDNGFNPTDFNREQIKRIYKSVSRRKRLECYLCKKQFFVTTIYKKNTYCNDCLNKFQRDGDDIDDSYDVFQNTVSNPSRMLIED